MPKTPSALEPSSYALNRLLIQKRGKIICRDSHIRKGEATWRLEASAKVAGALNRPERAESACKDWAPAIQRHKVWPFNFLHDGAHVTLFRSRLAQHHFLGLRPACIFYPRFRLHTAHGGFGPTVAFDVTVVNIGLLTSDRKKNCRTKLPLNGVLMNKKK